MITIEKFENIAKKFSILIEAKEYFIPSTWEQTQNLIKDRSGTILICVIPSTSYKGDNADVITENNESIIYVIQKERDGQSQAKQLLQYKETQEKLIKIKDDLLGDNEEGCKSFPFIQPKAMAIDPEYNIFGGWLGWSIKFKF